MESIGNHDKDWGKIVIPCPVSESKNPKGIRLRLNSTDLYNCSTKRKIWDVQLRGRTKGKGDLDT